MRTVFKLIALAVMTLPVAIPVALALEEDEDAKVKAAQKAVLTLTDAVAKGEKSEIDKQVADLAKNHGLEPIMHQFKIRQRGGIGFGAKPSRLTFKDGIERKIRDVADKKLSSRELKNEKDDLIRMAQVTIAIAKVSHLKAPKAKVEDMDPEDWKLWCKEMETSAVDLIKAIEAQDATAVRASARELNNRCSSCHGVFRTLN